MLLLNASTGTVMHNLISKVLAFGSCAQSFNYQNFDFTKKKCYVSINLEGVNCRLQVRVAGHCFSVADKTQALANC